ncbi:MAG: DNA-binding protein [Candidatus Omnitrophota bacterium]|jgi:predicted DNA-binding protein YlxM (UPF0122 family)|nr:MAG: DNA-binding protein [Candidatus Omnitrophota bacterium]
MESLEDKYTVSSLLDLYGGLLTKRQRTFFDLHYNEDLSYGEIAEMEQISRQAVHDTIQQGKKALIRFENVLHLVENGRRHHSEWENRQLFRKLIAEMARLLHDDIIYDTSPLRRKVEQLASLVERED